MARARTAQELDGLVALVDKGVHPFIAQHPHVTIDVTAVSGSGARAEDTPRLFLQNPMRNLLSQKELAL